MAQAAPVAQGGGGSLDGEALTGAVVGRTPWQLFWRRFRQDRFAFAGIWFILVLVVMAFGAPLIAKYGPHHTPAQLFPFEALNDIGLPVGPSKHFWFGADSFGRDLFVQVIYGARTSLIVALGATGLEIVLGIIFGVLAGFYGGKVDTVVSRIMDIMLALPVLLLAIGLVAACGFQKNGCLGGLIQPGLPLIIYVIGFFGWPYIARIVRGQVLSLREREFVEAARASGAGDFRIMMREIFPGVIAPIIVYSTLIIPTNILFESTLSFLGIGVPPSTPSWGQEISNATQIFQVAWWTMFFPGIFLLATTLAFNLVGDGLRDALDPRGLVSTYKKKDKKRTRRLPQDEAEAMGKDALTGLPEAS